MYIERERVEEPWETRLPWSWLEMDIKYLLIYLSIYFWEAATFEYDSSETQCRTRIVMHLHLKPWLETHCILPERKERFQSPPCPSPVRIKLSKDMPITLSENKGGRLLLCQLSSPMKCKTLMLYLLNKGRSLFQCTAYSVIKKKKKKTAL